MSARNINHEIIEELYSEALILADDARAAFDLRFQDNAADCNDLTRVALSIEGLRTTTRLMHVLAWLLNHRAYMAGELSDTQLEHCGTLPEERQADADNLARLEPETRALIEESERLHARVARIDAEYRMARSNSQPSCGQLHERLERQFAQG